MQLLKGDNLTATIGVMTSAILDPLKMGYKRSNSDYGRQTRLDVDWPDLENTCYWQAAQRAVCDVAVELGGQFENANEGVADAKTSHD